MKQKGWWIFENNSESIASYTIGSQIFSHRKLPEATLQLFTSQQTLQAPLARSCVRWKICYENIFLKVSLKLPKKRYEWHDVLGRIRWDPIFILVEIWNKLAFLLYIEIWKLSEHAYVPSEYPPNRGKKCESIHSKKISKVNANGAS